jgi:hypothetical protein
MFTSTMPRWLNLGIGDPQVVPHRRNERANLGIGDPQVVPHRRNERARKRRPGTKAEASSYTKHTFLGLLAKIKCSICSYQFNI